MPLDGENVQILASSTVNLLSLSLGCLIGWGSSGIKFLSSPESDLITGALTPSEAGLVNAVYCVGGLFGSLFYGYLTDKIGRVWSIRTIPFFQLMSCLLIAFARNSLMILISRIFVGISAGGVYTCIPLYVSEIAEDMIRGSLGSLLLLMAGVGVLLGYICGAHMKYNSCVWIYMIFPIIFVLFSAFLHETPFYLIKNQKLEKGKASVMFYRGAEKLEGNAFIEFEAMKKFVKRQVVEENVSLSNFLTKHARKSILIGCALVYMEQFSGCFALVFYTASTFENAGATSISPENAAIIIGVIQLVGAYTSTYTVDKAGRKVLICISAFGIFTGMTLFGIATQLIERGYDNTFIKLIPVFAVALSIFVANVGVFNLTLVVLSEISPSDIKNHVFTLAMCLSWVLMFIVFISYSPIAEILGLGGVMYFFAINSALGGIFTIFYIPETMGKSFEEIAALLDK